MIVFIATVFLLVSALHKGYCKEVCQTATCIKTASRMMESMNDSVDPCDDFFEFACRGWIKKNPIPPGAEAISVTGLIEQEIETNLREILETPDNDDDGKSIKLARAMYRTCMDEASIQNLQTKSVFGIWTKLGLPHRPPSDDEAKNFDISKIAAIANKFYGIGIFLAIHVAPDSMDNTKNQLMIQQISPGSTNLDILLRQPELYNAALQENRNYAKILFGAVGGGNESEQYTTELMDFMTKTANIMGTPADRKKANYNRGVMTIDKLQEITDPHSDTWNWTTFFKTIFEQTDVIVDTKNDTLFVNDVDYFVKLALLLNETSPGTIARYIWWQTFSQYRSRVYGPFLKTPRWKACTKVVNKLFDTVLTAAYVKKHFDEEYKKNATTMWADVSSSFDEMITELDWMDAETKAKAHEKARAVRAFIGYPELITNPGELEKYYEEWETLDGRLWDMYVQHHLITGKHLLNSWRQMPDKNKWLISGTSVNALNMLHINAVAIAAGMIHVPMYGNGVESLNYGGLGSMMGWKLFHSIDNLGRQRKANGNVEQWWNEATFQAYAEKVSCIMKQYGEFKITQLGNEFKLNKVQIELNSIANTVGLKIAFRAYEKFKSRSGPQQALPALDKYTDEQLLFLGFAQAWCGSETDDGLKKLIQASQGAPNRYKVIGILRNSAEFAKAWNCPQDSPMNPNKTCTMW